MAKRFVDFWVEEDLGSDHNIITATFTLTGTQQPKPLKTIKLYHKANWLHIDNTITTQMTKTQLNNKSTRKYINQYINKLTNTITTTLDQNVPTKTIKEDRIGLPTNTNTILQNTLQSTQYRNKKTNKNGK